MWRLQTCPLFYLIKCLTSLHNTICYKKKVKYALKEFTLSNFFIQNITEVLMCYSAVKCVESDTCPIRFTVCSNTNY